MTAHPMFDVAGSAALVTVSSRGIGSPFGYFATELTSILVADEAFSTWVRNRTPAGHWGDVDDLVGSLLYLVPPASRFVHGQIPYIDGGMLAVL